MMKAAAKKTVLAVLDDYQADPSKIARRGNSSRTIAFVPCAHPHFARFGDRCKNPPSGKLAVGVMVVETLTPHPDGLSVTGLYLHGTDDKAPKNTLVWVVEDETGTLDIDHLTRDGGPLDKATSGAWS